MAAILAISCKSQGKATCEKINDLCHTGLDCDKAADDYDKEYDKASDAEKEAADKQADCIDDADSCQAALACGKSSSSTTTSSSSSGGTVTGDAGR